MLAPDAALRLLAEGAAPHPGHRLLAPAALRSQLLAALYTEVRAGRLDRAEAQRRLDAFRALAPRLLGDRVLQRHAWDIAETLDWPDTALAEYLALTRLQADALVTTDPALASAAAPLVATAPYAALLAP